MAIYFDLMKSSYPFAIESIGENRIQEDISRPNGYPAYHWLQTTKGIGIMEIKGEKISLPENCGLLLSPFVPHKYYQKSKEPWQTSFVTITGSFLNQVSEFFKEEEYLFITDVQYYLDWIHRMMANYENQKFSQIDYSVATYEFILHLNAQLSNHPDTTHKLYQLYLKPAIHFIENHYGEDFSVETLAQQAFVTPQYLNRLFQRFFNLTSTEYLTQFRIKKSKEFLITKKETEIQLIGQLVGFKSASHFIATFKKSTGFTPLAFRELYTN